jgi:ribosomal protein S18 acetylase RimI-like enzyme
VLTQPRQASTGSRSSSISIVPSVRLGSFPPAGAGQPLHYGAMTSPTYRIRRAVPGDIPAILGLIGSAAAWLQRYKNTDQWAKPWPTEDERDARIARGVSRKSTWIVEQDGALAGTITCRDKGLPKLWTAEELAEPAVYVCRLITSREQAGRGLGAALIDWAGLRGIDGWAAESIRVDVWTTNTALHDYYKGQGFEHLRTLQFTDPWEYPSAALFQKPITAIDRSAAGRFETEVS